MGYVAMEFIETTLFSRIREDYFDDLQFHRLQLFLMERPEAGTVIRGSGGVRKLRWRLGQRGKRGGARVLYYWIARNDQILLLTVYGKYEADDISPDSIRAMRDIVKNL